MRRDLLGRDDRAARESPHAAVDDAHAEPVGLGDAAIGAAATAPAAAEAAEALEAGRELSVTDVERLRAVAREADVGVGAPERLGRFQRGFGPVAILRVLHLREGRHFPLGVDGAAERAQRKRAGAERLHEISSCGHKVSILRLAENRKRRVYRPTHWAGERASQRSPRRRRRSHSPPRQAAKGRIHQADRSGCRACRVLAGRTYSRRCRESRSS